MLMETFEIICESCSSQMRLSTALLSKIAGRTGRVTCKECQNKIVLDGRGDGIVVQEGGRTALREIEEIDDFSEVPPSVDPHLSMLPPGGGPTTGEVSLPPPLPADAAGRRAKSKADAKPAEFEAPAPVMGGNQDSLSPITVSDGDDDEMVSLGREFNSSPFASERDETYRSLFPTRGDVPGHDPLLEEAPKPQLSPGPGLSKRPSPPKRRPQMDSSDELEDTGTATVAQLSTAASPSRADAKKGDDSQETSGVWVPWAVAAIALLGLGVSVSIDRAGSATAESDASSEVVGTAAAATDSTAVDEEPAHAEQEEAEGFDVAADQGDVLELDQTAQDTTDLAPVKTEAAAAAEPGDGHLESESDAARSESEASEAETANEAAEAKAEASDEEQAEDADAIDDAEEESEEAPELAPFSTASAATALREATALASACRKTDDPTGRAKVVVTFAPSGRVTRSVVIGSPYAGTQTGGCIASRFRTARVPAFSGDNVTVTKTVSIR